MSRLTKIFAIVVLSISSICMAQPGTPTFSDDGRYMVEPSSFSFDGQIYLVDRVTGERQLVSADASGNAGDNGSFYGYISGNGRYVVYTSYATNIVQEKESTESFRDIFLYDRLQKTNTKISVSSDGITGDGTSQNATITPDGRFVAFYSFASNLDSVDTNDRLDVFIHDTQTGKNRLISLNDNGLADPFGVSGSNLDDLSISSDGRYVLFQVSSTTFLTNDSNAKEEVVVRDTLLNTTTRIGLDDNGNEGNDWSLRATISRDGSFVVFNSRATNLVGNDRNEKLDVFIRHLDSGTTKRISIDENGSERDEYTIHPVLSADDRFVAYRSHGLYEVYYVHNLEDGSFRTYFDHVITGLSSSGFIEYRDYGWLPLHIDPLCPDYEGNNMGPDNCVPFSIDESELNATIYAGVECIDGDGDGWGWQKPDRTPGRSCQVSSDQVIIEEVSDSHGIQYCIDTDGDGWGWDGATSCRINQTTEGICVDADGDYWGWNGVASCEIPR